MSRSTMETETSVANSDLIKESGGTSVDSDPADQTEPIEVDEINLSLANVLRTPCFEGFEGKRMTYLYTTQLTCSNVMSTVVTARPVDTTVKRRGVAKHAASRNQAQDGGGTSSGPPGSVYAQPCNPKKVKKNGRYQAQLPAFRRSLPALPIPIPRLNQELVQERDKFMKQLKQEREEKQRLDNWAATKIQACYRGFRCRPRVVVRDARHRLNTVATIRLDLSDMEHTLKQTEEPILTNAPSSVSPWRSVVQQRAHQKRSVLTRKEQMQVAATRIQACVKGFMARFGYAQLLSRHYDEVYVKAVIKIQSVFRGYRLRAKTMSIATRLQTQAAIQIQSLIRGIQARERVCTLAFERKCDARRQSGQPLQFTLPNRTKDIVRTSSIRVLFEDRKSSAYAEFKTAKWREERMYLHMNKVATKLHHQRQLLLRWKLELPKTRLRKKKSRLDVALAATSASTISSASSSPIGSSVSLVGRPGRRRMGGNSEAHSPKSTSPKHKSSTTTKSLKSAAIST